MSSTTSTNGRVGRPHGTVFVTGASGFLGTHLVRRLVADANRVRVLVRTPERATAIAGDGVEALVGDITDEEAIRAGLTGADVVYHLAGKLFAPGEPSETYRRTHTEGTRLLLACCRTNGGVRRLVHCSTTGVLGSTGEEAAAEDAPYHPTNAYEATKVEAEEAVADANRAGLPTVVVRPGLVYGPGDLHLLGFFQTVLRRRFRPIGARPVWLHPIFVDDMTDALIRCGTDPAALGECFHIAGREPVRLDGLAAEIAEAGGTTLPRGHIPMAAARVVATMGDALPPRLRQAAPLTRSRLSFLTHSRVYDVSKARRLLDFVATTDLRTGIALSVEWYREQGLLPAAGAPS